jgi:hypothetical protein
VFDDPFQNCEPDNHMMVVEPDLRPVPVQCSPPGVAIFERAPGDVSYGRDVRVLLRPNPFAVPSNFDWLHEIDWAALALAWSATATAHG